MTAQGAQQLLRAAVGGDHQGLRQARRDFAADAGVGDAVEQRQATEMPGNMPGPQEAGEELFQQSEVHGVTPARGNRRAGTANGTAPDEEGTASLARPPQKGRRVRSSLR